MTFLTTYTTSIDVPDAAPAFFLAFAGSSLIARLTLGRIQDRYGDNIVVYPLYASFFTAMVLIAVVPQMWTIILAGVLGGVGFGTLMSSTQAITIRRAGPTRVGVATSTYFFMIDIGFGLGPVALGALIAATSFTTMYAVAALLVGVSGVLYWLVHGRFAAPEAGGVRP
nr:MFS transporter [Brevibacterium luteolum]